MGLEAINFFFRSEKQLSKEISKKKGVNLIEGSRYVYKKDNNFWIDLELQDSYLLSLRITLCNPHETTLPALDELLSFLFNLGASVLTDMSTKRKFSHYDNEVRKLLEESYMSRKEEFMEIYGDYTAAISSEEFYKGKGKGNS